MRGRGRVHGGGVMLVGTGLVAAFLVGSLLGQDALGARLSSRAPAPSGGITASVDASLGDMIEVWGATDEGDTLPTDQGELGPAPAAAAVASAPPTLYTRVPRPVLTGPRRVGIQVGHWQTDQAPAELARLRSQTGTSWDGVTEVDINLDVANRVKRILEQRGFVADVLPTIIPTGYVADAFVALHGDGDGTGDNSGFKMAYGSRRTPYEADLLNAIKTEYGAATGLAYDQARVSRAMLTYYVFSWQRNRYSTHPLTPSVILEMGYVSNDNDRALMTGHADLVAGAIASGIVRFLDGHSRDTLFGQDLLVPAIPQFAPRPSPSPAG